MSAFIVSPEHIAELAKYLSTERCSIYNQVTGKKICDSDDVELVAGILARANVYSVCARYSDETPDKHMTFILEAMRKAEGLIKIRCPKSIWSMASCLDYQSCEVEQWAHTDAYWVINAIQDHAAREILRGLPDARVSWSYHEEVGQ